MQTSLPADRQHVEPMSGKKDQVSSLKDWDNPLWELLAAAEIIQSTEMMFLVYSVFNLPGEQDSK